MQELKQTTQRYFLIALSIITGLLGLRFLLVLFGVAQTFPGGTLLLGITDPFIYPFFGVWTDWSVGSLVWSWSIVLAVIFWIVVGLVLLDLLLTFIDDDPLRILINLADAFLKVFEFLVLARFILVLFNVPNGSVFVETVYSLTGWARLGLGEANILGGRLEIGSMVAFVILLTLDIFWESLADKYIVQPRKVKKETSKTTTTTKVETNPIQQAPITFVVPTSTSPSVTVLSKEQFEELKQDLKKSK